MQRQPSSLVQIVSFRGSPEQAPSNRSVPAFPLRVGASATARSDPGDHRRY